MTARGMFSCYVCFQWFYFRVTARGHTDPLQRNSISIEGCHGRATQAKHACAVCEWDMWGWANRRQAIGLCLSGTVMRPNKSLLRTELERKSKFVRVEMKRRESYSRSTAPTSLHMASVAHTCTPCQFKHLFHITGNKWADNQSWQWFNKVCHD